jgi:hypothetical protein
MGANTPWSTNYPTSVDDGTSQPVLADAVDDVIASHPNALSEAGIALQKENTGYKDNQVITAATNQSESLVDAERVIGSLLFNGENLYHLIPHLRILATYNLNGGAAQGDLVVRLYDMGVPGTPLLPPELRAEVSISNTDDGELTKAQAVLALTASPSIASDEIHDSQRLYEVRVIQDGAPSGATSNVYWAGIALGKTQ